MKIAIRENEIFIESNWQDKFIEEESLLLEKPYNYTIVEINEEIDFKLLEYSHFEDNVFNIILYNNDINTENFKKELQECKQFLDSTDNKVNRYLRQSRLNKAKKTSDIDFTSLENEREEKADRIEEIESILGI